jgi:hypothetical protein
MSIVNAIQWIFNKTNEIKFKFYIGLYLSKPSSLLSSHCVCWLFLPLSCVVVTGVGSVGPRLMGHDLKAQDRLRKAWLSQIEIVNRPPSHPCGEFQYIVSQHNAHMRLFWKILIKTKENRLEFWLKFLFLST